MCPARKEPRQPRTTEDVQVDLIVDAYRAEGRQVKAARDDDGNVEFLYEEGVILVRDAYLDRVERLLGGGEVRDGFTEGVTLFSLRGAKIRTALEAVSEVDLRIGVGVATPNHIFSVAPVHHCPATEPEEVPRHSLPDPGQCEGGGGGLLIHAPDSGLVPGASAHPWLAGVTGQLDPLPPPDSQGVVLIPGYAGHGTFVAGVARCQAPVAAVHVTRDFNEAGAVSEAEIVVRLHQALRQGANIISLSAGGFTRKDLPPLGFESFWQRYRHYKGVMMVAAAGNNSVRKPFWPAAFPHVVGVGALAANWRDRAYFSNFGPWVDVYAPGQDLVNAFATGTYVCREPPHTGQVRHFQGMARWSGTSFATPLVAGLIAARVSRAGESARQAAQALLAQARAQRIPGVGPVLRPCDTGDSDGCRCCHDSCGCCGKH
jgi:hypothetical protein